MKERLRINWQNLAMLGAAFWLALATPVTAQESAGSDLAADIQRWADADREADPVATLAALLALETRLAQAPNSVQPRARGELYAMIGVAFYAQQELEAAAQWMERAQAAYAEAGDAPDKLAEVALNRAILLRRENRLAEAEEAARTALAIRQGLYDRPHTEIASALNALGNVLYSQGQYEPSLAIMREALATERSADPGNHRNIVMRLDSLAVMLDETGRDDEALATARAAEEMARMHLGTSHRWHGYALNTLGLILLDMGRYSEAVPVIRDTIAHRLEQLGPDHPYTNSAVMSLAVALQESGQLHEASELAAQAMPVLLAHRGLMDTNTLVGFHRIGAGMAASLADWELYFARIAEAEADLGANIDQANPAVAIFWMAHAHQLHRLGRNSEALALAERWVPLLQAKLIAQNNDRLFGEMLRARLRQTEGQDESAGSAVQAMVPLAAQLIDKLSDIAASDRDLARDARANSATLRLYLEAMLAAGEVERTFEAAQLLTLSELSLAQQRSASAGEGAEGEGLGSRRTAFAVHGEITDLQRRISLAQKRSDGAQTLTQLAAMRDQLAERVAELRADYPDYVARYRPRPVTLAHIRAALRSDDVLIIPLELDGEGLVARLDAKQGLTWSRFDSAALREDVAIVRRAVAGGASLGSFPFAAAARSYARLLPGGVPENGRVLSHGGGASASLPLALLVTRPFEGPLSEAPWLALRASSQVVGNLALFAANSGARAEPLAPAFAGIGGVDLPDADGLSASLFRSGMPESARIADLPALPNAAAELARMAQALPRGAALLLVGPDAAEERVKQVDLSSASIIAFATHGLVAGEMRDLWEPALLLGTNDPLAGEDGLLSASEIARLDLNADWVILSACNTAAGEDGAAPVYSGLASAFAQAGARSLMLSHWRVRDDASALLSVDTVRLASGAVGRAQALRQAQLSLLSSAAIPDAAHPAIWAPFVIVEN